MKKKLKTVLRTALLILIAIMIGVSVYSFNASRVAGNAVPMPFGVGVAVVLSGSMEPDLSVGDLLLIAERDDYAVGDDVVYQDGHMAVVHRIIAFEDGKVITQGVANNVPDDPIDPSVIKGEVVLSVPFVGYLVDLIKTPLGIIVLLGLAVWLLESSFRREKKKDMEKLEDIKEEIRRLKEQQNKDTEN